MANQLQRATDEAAYNAINTIQPDMAASLEALVGRGMTPREIRIKFFGPKSKGQMAVLIESAASHIKRQEE